MPWKAAVVSSLALGLVVAGVAATRPARSAEPPRPSSTPIRHVVIIFQENHSFDDVLGKLCATNGRGAAPERKPCDGATTGKTHDGKILPLRKEPDLVPQ